MWVGGRVGRRRQTVNLLRGNATSVVQIHPYPPFKKRNEDNSVLVKIDFIVSIV